jgi:hypothetical protein
MDKQELVIQTKRAFDFIQKLYLEVSYLIKEIEGLLAEEDEHFVIGRPSGYHVTFRSSSGLEPANVTNWMPRNMAVFFIPESFGHLNRGQTNTILTPDLKIIYLRIRLDGQNLNQPKVHAGVLFNFNKKPSSTFPEKFEQAMAHLEYQETQAFKNIEEINYQDSYFSFHGKLIEVPLYDLNNSEDVLNCIVEPVLSLYRNNV